MTTPNDKNFSEWLQKELDDQGLSQSDLIRAAKAKGYSISRAAVSEVLSRRRAPGKRFLTTIAAGLDKPIEEVYRAANFLRPVPKKQELIERIQHELDTLPPEDQDDVMDYIEFKRRQLEKRRRRKNK